MDLRHYDTKAHDLDSSYEDVQPGFSTPHGVARTSELTLFPTAAVPAKDGDRVARQARAAAAAAGLRTPEYMHSAEVFGIWSLPDRSTAAKKPLEDQLDAAFAFYHKEVDQRTGTASGISATSCTSTTDARHVWRYDVGGFAWDNSELGTDLWLWYTLPAHRTRRRLPHGGGHDAAHQRGRHLSPRPVRQARLAAQRAALGLRRQAARISQAALPPLLLLPDHRRTHRRPDARGGECRLQSHRDRPDAPRFAADQAPALSGTRTACRSSDRTRRAGSGPVRKPNGMAAMESMPAMILSRHLVSPVRSHSVIQLPAKASQSGPPRTRPG